MIRPSHDDPRHLAVAKASPLGWAWMASGGDFARPRHVVAMHDATCEALSRPSGGRLLVEIPPRHGKTTWLRFVLGWWLCLHATRSAIYASHSASLSARAGRLVRNDIEAHGRAVFGIGIASDAKAKGEWALETGGEFYAVGVGGSPHGRGAHLLVTDDLVPNAEAASSPVQMARVEDSLRSDLMSRREEPFVHLGIQTRWSIGDPHGLCRDLWPGAYETLRLPALAEPGDPLGRLPGEPLWPERFPASHYDEIRLGMHPHRWEALYQQRPVEESGGVWRREWWKDRYVVEGTFARLPDGSRVELDHCRRYVTADLAVTKSTMSDWTAIACWAVVPGPDPMLLLLEVKRLRIEGPDIVPTIRRAMSDHGATVAWMDVGGQQATFVQEARRAGIAARSIGRSHDCDLVLPGDKVATAHLASPRMARGRVLLPASAHWLPDWEAEMVTFPGKHDDMADATAWGILLAERMARSAPVEREPARPMKRDPWQALDDSEDGLDAEAASQHSSYARRLGLPT